MEYNNELVLATINGRIHPFEDKDIPDAICSLIITEKMLYVSEDNYDGTYTDHYSAPIEKVEGIAIEKPYRTSLGPMGPRGSAYSDRSMNMNYGLPLHGLIAAIFDFFDPYLAEKNGNVRAKYLVVHYIEKDGSKKIVFFNEVNKSAKKFVKEWEKIKKLH